MEVIPNEEEVAVDAIPLATKPPSIVDWKIIKEGKISHFQIIRADGSSKRYSAFIQMLKNFDREDLETLWKLVKAKHGSTRPEEGYERVLWVHFLRVQSMHIFMLEEKIYPLTPATIIDMLNRKLQADHWNEMCYHLLELITKIKRIHDDLEVTAAKVKVTAAKQNLSIFATACVLVLLVYVSTARVKLVLLVKIEENILITTAERLQLLEEFMLTEKRSKTYQRKDNEYLRSRLQ
ncbi:hypothetical protein Tco_1096612 [Tanacetum coccineum]